MTKKEKTTIRRIKPLAIISGIGGVLIGGAVVVLKRKSKTKALPQPVELPDDAQWIILKTDEFDVMSDEKIRVWIEYTLQPTRFKVWHLLEGKDNGFVVYYITQQQHLVNPDGKEREFKGESFYGLVAVPGKKRDLIGYIQKGNKIAFHVCLVGGSPNGIPAGEKIITRGTLKEWKFITSESLN